MKWNVQRKDGRASFRTWLEREREREKEQDRKGGQREGGGGRMHGKKEKRRK